MLHKEWISAIAIALTVIAFIPYIRSVLRKETRPHVISWLIWGGSTAVVFLAQLADGGGAGAWPVGVSAIMTLTIATLAYANHSDHAIACTDWGMLLLALLAMPLWVLTHDPVWAVAILTIVDVLGFVPSFSKAWRLPNEESLPFFVIMAIRNGLVIAALQHHSLTTVLFPAVSGAACVVFVAMVWLRRRVAFSAPKP